MEMISTITDRMDESDVKNVLREALSIPNEDKIKLFDDIILLCLQAVEKEEIKDNQEIAEKKKLDEGFEINSNFSDFKTWLSKNKITLDGYKLKNINR